MLSRYMQSNEYSEDIEAVVDENPEFKEKEKEFLEAVKSLNLNVKTIDLIDRAAVFMMITARDLAYRKGFHDGVNTIVECTSGHNKANDELTDWFMGIAKKDPVQAYRVKEIIEMLSSLSEDDQAEVLLKVKETIKV